MLQRIVAAWAAVSCTCCSLLFPYEPHESADPCEGVQCPSPEQTCVAGYCLATACLQVTCDEGLVCWQGDCVSPLLDADGDGFPVTSDCDDADPDVVDGSVIACSSACGEGTRTCRGGVWDACTAPDSCSCEPGTTRSEPCGRCGTAVRTCTAEGVWGMPSDCGAEGECNAGATSGQPCGVCATQSRTCNADCRWGAWGECVATGSDCAPGTLQEERCGNCGVRTRTCNDQCLWPPFGACVNEGCQPTSERRLLCGDCGTKTQRCDDACQWFDTIPCAEDPRRSCDDGIICTEDSCDAAFNCQHLTCEERGTQCCSYGCHAVGCCVDADCGPEPLCTDLFCLAEGCVSAFETTGYDPEDECPGTSACEGGSCQ